jgi:replicative DNA helicase
MNARTAPTDLAADSDVAHLRVPPHSIEAEQSVLGALLLDNGAWDRAGDLLAEGDFYSHEHRAIYGVIGRLVQANKPADVITVFDELQSMGRAEECGGLAYLNALAQSVPGAANLRRYADIVRERGVNRQVIAACDAIATKAFAGTAASEVLDLAASAFSQLERAGRRVEPQPLAGLIASALDRYSALAEGHVAPAIPTGIAPLDRLLNGGLRAGKVYGIAARPSVGKSAAGRCLGLNAARLGHATLLLSQEMPCDEVADCVVAQMAGIDSERLQTGGLRDAENDWGRLADAVDEIRDWPFYVDEQGGLRLSDIRAKARSVKGLRLLILDYLQLSRSTLKNATTNDQVAELSKGLKALAMEMKVAIVVLSQLNRDVEKRADREPQLSDLRDSGAIEQDLDAAVMLWTIREEDGGDRRLVGWKVAKHRSGRKGRFGMTFDAPHYRWRDATESISPQLPAAAGGKGDL